MIGGHDKQRDGRKTKRNIKLVKPTISEKQNQCYFFKNECN